MAAEFRIVAIFKLRAVPSRIILHQVESEHSVAEFMEALDLREQTAVS